MNFVLKRYIIYFISFLWLTFSFNSLNAQCNLLCNTDFENNQITQSVIIVDTSLVPCWATTASDNKIEVWSSGFNGIPAYSGNQFIELNAFFVSTLFQNFTATPGTSVTISFAHRGRAGTDVMGVSIGPVGGALTSLGTFSDGNASWGYYSVNYVIPSGFGNNFTLQFNSISASGGDPALGNFLDAITVSLPSNATLNLTSTPISCNGLSDGSAQVLINGGLAPYTYTWSSNGGNNANASNLSAGIYSVQITEANGCSKTGTVLVGVTPSPTLNINSQDVSCVGSNDGSAQVFVTGGVSPYTYTWTPTGLNTSSISGLSSGIYTVNVSSGSIGCISTATVLIGQGTSLNLNLISQNVTCFGASDGSASVNVNNNIGTLTYTWLPIGINTPSVNGLSAGNFTLYCSSSNGCTGTNIFTISEPSELTLSINSNGISCADVGNGYAQVVANGDSPPYSYLWSITGQNTYSVAGLTPGTYSCIVTDANFCSKSTTVSILTALSPTITVNTPTVCSGNTTFLSANGASTYTWLPSNIVSNVLQIKPNITSTYTVIGENLFGCKDTVSTTVSVNQIPYVFAGNDTIIDVDGLITLSAVGSGTLGWTVFGSNENLPCNFCQEVTVNPQVYTCYILEVVNEYGCFNRDTICIDVIDDWNVYIPNTFTPNKNDRNEVFIPVGYGIKVIELEVFDRWGELIFKSSDEIIGWDGTYKNKICQDGVYVYKVNIITKKGYEAQRVGHITLLK